MKTRTLLLMSLVLNAGLGAGLAIYVNQTRSESLVSLSHALPPQAQGVTTVGASSGTGFGPVYSATLPANPLAERSEMFDMEKGRRLFEPDFEVFNCDAAAAVKWSQSVGVDLCGYAGSGRVPCCVAYYMAVLPCGMETWERGSASEIVASPELEQMKSPKRKCLFPSEKPSCYMFRTQEGTYGLLKIIASDTGMRIFYKFAISGTNSPGNAKQA
jgi:hypothetical protein